MKNITFSDAMLGAGALALVLIFLAKQQPFNNTIAIQLLAFIDTLNPLYLFTGLTAFIYFRTLLVDIAIQVFGLFMEGVKVLLVVLRNIAIKQKNKYDATMQTGFMTGIKRLKTFNRFNKGFRIGRNAINLVQTFLSTIIHAPMGGGKTNIILTWLLQLMNCSVVINDPAQELIQTSGYLKSKGFEILRFIPSAPHLSFYFNPIELLHELPNGSDFLSKILIEQSFGGSGGSDNAFWHQNGQIILKACIEAVANISLMEGKKKYGNLCNVYELLNQLAYKPEKTMAIICNHIPERMASEFKAKMGGDPRQVASHISTASTSLAFFASDTVAQITSKNTINFHKLRQTPTAVFINLDEMGEQKYFAPILNIFYSFLFLFMTKGDAKDYKKSLPVHVMLEELASMGRLGGTQEFLGKMLSVSRKYRISINVLLQDPFNQLTSPKMYGKEIGRSILNNVANHIILGGLAGQSRKYAMELVGKVKKEDKKEWILDEDEIEAIPLGQGVLCMKKKKPIYFSLKAVEDYRFLNKRLKMGAITAEPHPVVAPEFIDVDSPEFDYINTPQKEMTYEMGKKNVPKYEGENKSVQSEDNRIIKNDNDHEPVIS